MSARKGWGRPDGAQVWHYFTGPTSLCGRWQFGGTLDELPHWWDTPLCRTCKQKADKR